MKPGQMQQRRGIYLTHDFGHKRKSNNITLFICELLITSENRILHFLDRDIFMDGRNRQLKIN